MRVAYCAWRSGEPVPVERHLPARKLGKYLSRESAAAVVVAAGLFGGERPDSGTPVYYTTGVVGHEDFGLAEMLEASRGAGGVFSRARFLSGGIAQVSPLTQFKVLYNMPLCFLSIFFGFTGDNMVLYGTAGSLLGAAQSSPHAGPLLLGAGKVHEDGAVAAGFALGTREEFAVRAPASDCGEAVELFRAWAGQ